jgi:hypothetical protein
MHLKIVVYCMWRAHEHCAEGRTPISNSDVRSYEQ